MKKCSKCGTEYEDNAQSCVRCGQPLAAVEHPAEKPAGSFRFSKIAVIMLMVVIVIANAYYLKRILAAEARKQTASEQIEIFSQKADFLDSCIVLYHSDAEDGYYHYYGCPELHIPFSIATRQLNGVGTAEYSWDNMDYLTTIPEYAMVNDVPPCPECARQVTQVDGNVISINLLTLSPIEREYGLGAKEVIYEMLPALTETK